MPHVYLTYKHISSACCVPGARDSTLMDLILYGGAEGDNEKVNKYIIQSKVSINAKKKEIKS